MGLKIFGYAGCTTVKKAVKWAEENGQSPDYSHFNKVDDLKSALESWIDAAGMDRVFNDKSQTFKKMDDGEKAAILKDTASMVAAMENDPRLIKRPVGTDGKTVLTGFDVADWEKAFT